ncbi:putative Acetyltransferase, GNAT family family [Xenorhabdus nematophila F1]|uniref:GNAT family N-acetyltransferase n=1 Tax=Xenorhabdus nematophila TaxID=628 RepID=UPI0003275A38|nr:GNAT family N-acetyltransferase [Xenorhabdus nematophila]CCW30706.1 putative Acetyltransferase, GNAT family family [Xenorhabdus nematophila F1]
MNKHHLSLAILAHHQIEDYFYSSISKINQYISNNVRAYVTGVEAYILNFLLVIDNHAQVAEDLKKGIRLMDENTSIPFAIYAMEPNSQTLEVIQQAGFILDEDNITTGMKLDLLSWQSNDIPMVEYEIRCVDRCLDDWAMPVESAFESDNILSGQYQACHQTALDAGKSLQHYALYVDNQPVCALTLSWLGNNIRLDDIGTRVEQQRKGYASVLINYVLNDARQKGAIACYLDAACDGNGLYQRIGFKTLFEYQGFARE